MFFVLTCFLDLLRTGEAPFQRAFEVFYSSALQRALELLFQALKHKNGFYSSTPEILHLKTRGRFFWRRINSSGEKNDAELYSGHRKKIKECTDNPDILQGLHGLIETAKTLHAEERNISLLSVQLVGLLEENNGPGNCMLSREGFAWYIGLTPNAFWKRAQAWRVLKRFPKIEKMIKLGETCVSHVAMLSAKITESNAGVMIEGLKNKSTRELRDFIATVNTDGSIKPSSESIVEIKLRLSVANANLIERAREVLAHASVKTNGTPPSHEDVVVAALNILLDRKDPMRKAERAVLASASKQNGPDLEVSATESAEVIIPAARQDSLRSTQPRLTFGLAIKGRRRTHIPNAIRHRVWQRDKGNCTHDLGHGHICGDRYMIEVDHLIPLVKGGTHTIDNLALKCRRHNLLAAEQNFGAAFMGQFRNVD